MRSVEKNSPEKAAERESANSFSVRFESKYGPGSVDEFNKIAMDPHKSLAEAARRYGFSREYARHVFRQIHGFPYTQIVPYKKRVTEEQSALERMKQSKREKAKRKR